MNVAFGYLLDENLNAAIIDFSARHHPELSVYSMGDGRAPPKGTLDPEVLDWCEAHDCVLVTDNRRSMPGHLADHVAAGHHVEGIFQVGSMTVAALGNHLAEVAWLSFPGEFRDIMRVLPLY